MKAIRPRTGVLVAMTTAILLGPATGWAQPLPGSAWKPITLNGKNVPADSAALVQFGDDGQVAGHGGCNNFTGKYSTHKKTITIGPLAATRKACVEPVMNLEIMLFQVLDGSRSFQRNGTDLLLLDDAGAEIARFRQTGAG